jgi:hypothetical protein
VYRCSINYDQGQLSDDLTQMVKGGNHDFSVDDLFKDERMKAQIRTQKASTLMRSLEAAGISMVSPTVCQA